MDRPKAAIDKAWEERLDTDVAPETCGWKREDGLCYKPEGCDCSTKPETCAWEFDHSLRIINMQCGHSLPQSHWRSWFAECPSCGRPIETNED